LNGVRVIPQMAADPAGRWADTAAAPLIQRGNRDASGEEFQEVYPEPKVRTLNNIQWADVNKVEGTFTNSRIRYIMERSDSLT
jgi:hypothetical protein